jgi:tetratricopeptide (TPR) repeat protein
VGDPRPILNPYARCSPVDATPEESMNVETAYFAASKEYQKGNYIPALQVLNELLDMRRDSKTYTLLAKTLMKLGMKAEAAAAYQSAAQQGGQRAEEHLRHAMKLYFEAGRTTRPCSSRRSSSTRRARMRRSPSCWRRSSSSAATDPSWRVCASR